MVIVAIIYAAAWAFVPTDLPRLSGVVISVLVALVAWGALLRVLPTVRADTLGFFGCLSCRFRGRADGSSVLPHFPRRFAALPQLGQMLFVAQGVHRLPEAVVLPGYELVVFCECLHRFAFP